MSRRSAAPHFALLVGLLSACAQDLPDPELIVKTRILALRVEVVESLVDEEWPEGVTRTEALPLETVLLDPFVVGPEGTIDPDTLDPVFIACQLLPGQGLFGCISASFPIELADIPECPVIDITQIDPMMPPEVPSPCIAAREGAPEYIVPFTPNVLIGGSVEMLMIAGDPGGITTDACAADLLAGDAELPADCLYAVQRIDIGPQERMLLLLAELGIEIDGLPPPEDPEDVPEPDLNPRISEFMVTVIADGETMGESTVIERGDLVEVELGQTIRVDVTSPEEDLQTYLVPVNNGEDYETRDELYAGSWFRTWGLLLSGTSDDPVSYNEWTFDKGDQDDSEVPEDGRAFLYYAVRDGRLGVNWFWFEVAVTEP